MKIAPLGDRILVRLDEVERKSKGGIHFPETTEERPMFGTVAAAGDGRMDDHGHIVALRVKEGDRVLIGRYSGTELTIDEIKYSIVREEDVLGVVTGK